jgi:hypothetical protein
MIHACDVMRVALHNISAVLIAAKLEHLQHHKKMP